jgi:hypothetical protein
LQNYFDLRTQLIEINTNLAIASSFKASINSFFNIRAHFDAFDEFDEEKQ